MSQWEFGGVSVNSVYGGQLTLQGLKGKGQGWSPDLLQFHTEAFKVLASKVENSVSFAADGGRCC